MASSFKGWGTSWAQTWDRISDPNAMYGSASITFTATGLLTNALPPIEPPESVPEEPPKYYAVEKPKSEGELLMVQALEEDEMLLAMLHVLVEEL